MSYDSAIQLLDVYPNENIYPHKNLYTNVSVYNNFAQNSQKLKTTQMSINRQMYKQTVVYPYDL